MQGSTLETKVTQRGQARLKAEGVRQKAQSSKLKGKRGKGKRKSEEHGSKPRQQKAVSNLNTMAMYRTGQGFHGASLLAYLFLSILCGILAFLSKQNTASLPAAILLVEYIFVDRTWQGWKKKMIWFAPAFTIFMIVVLYVSGLFSGELKFSSLLEDVSELMQETRLVSRWNYLCTQFNVLVIYIRLLFLPIGQNMDYVYPFKMGFFDAYTPMAFLSLTGLAGLGIWNRKKAPIITFAVLWFFITLSVESSIIPIRDALFEHRLYLPMFGFALIVSYLLFDLLSKKRLWPIVISVSIIVCLGMATYLRNRIWQDGITLWSDVVSKNPESYRAHDHLGVYLARQGRIKEGISHYSKAIQINPDFANARNNLGVALVRQGKLKEAMGYFSAALRINPDYANAHNNLGNALARQGHIKEAISHYSKAIQINPDYANAYNNLGNALARQGRIKEAISHYSKAIQINPDHAEAHYNLGVALEYQGSLKESIIHFQEALRIKPGYYDYVK